MKPVRQKLALARMPRPKASIAILDVLDELREEAMAGRITAFALVAVRTQGYSMNTKVIEDAGSTFVLLGEIDCLKARIRDGIRDLNGGQI